MEFQGNKLTQEINTLSISNFNIENWQDSNKLKNILRCLFTTGDIVFFHFRREEDLTDEQELKRLRPGILQTFRKKGEYLILKEIDEARFDSAAMLSVTEDFYDFILDLWRYFYGCSFFTPADGFSFQDYIVFLKKIKFTDKGGENILRNGDTLFQCIKGLGGDNLIVSYHKNYQMPDLKTIVANTPDIKDMFR